MQSLTPATSLFASQTIGRELGCEPKPCNGSRPATVVEIVRRIADRVGFVVLPRRWAVERISAFQSKSAARRDSEKQSQSDRSSSAPHAPCSRPAASRERRDNEAQ